MGDDLTHICWIGGVTSSGKSTVAHLLAEAGGLVVYSTDEHFDRHASEALQAAQPTMYAYQHDDPVTMADRPAAAKAKLSRGFYLERFPMIAAELVSSGPAIAEGTDLLPDCVAGVAEPTHAAWLLPTRDFWERRHFQRDWASNDDWDYYEAMIEHHRERCATLDLHLIEVDGRRSAEDIARDLRARFDV